MFYTYGMGPEGDPSVAVKQMWIFKISGEVSNEAVCRHGVIEKSFSQPALMPLNLLPPLHFKNQKKEREDEKTKWRK